MVDSAKLLLFKKEAIYGTDAVPTAQANAAYTRNFTSKPVVVDRIQRNLDRPVRGRTKDAPSNERGTFGYELEMAGSGVAGTAPAWMEHLEACGMAAPVITAGASAVQRFAAIGTALSAASAYHWRGNQRAVHLGARGTFGFEMTAGQYPFFKFDFTGMLPPAAVLSDVAPPEINLDRWKDPQEVNTANTLFLLDGYAARLRSWTADVNAEVKARNLVGANYIQRGNHAIAGKIMCEAPTIATKNYFSTLRSGAEVTAQAIQGTVPGAIVQLDGAHLQITDIDYQDEDDVAMLSIGFGLNVGTTPDDLVLTAK